MGVFELNNHPGLIERCVSGKHWTELIKDPVKRQAVEAHHCDICLVVSRRKQFSPWRQRQRNQRTPRNFSVSSSPLLDQEALEKILLVAGVLIRSPLFPPAPLFSPLMVGKAKEEGAFQETHGIAKLCKAKEERERSKQGSKYSLASVLLLLVSVSASSRLPLHLFSSVTSPFVQKGRS